MKDERITIHCEKVTLKGHLLRRVADSKINGAISPDKKLPLDFLDETNIDQHAVSNKSNRDKFLEAVMMRKDVCLHLEW